MKVLGISAFYHDSAAALVGSEGIIAAVQEERFTRKKHDAGFPLKSIEYCLQKAKCKINDVDMIVFYDKPLLKFERLLETYYSFAPRGFASFIKSMPVWLGDKLFLKDLIVKTLMQNGASKQIAEKLLFAEHHRSHAASAFFASPYQNAAVLTLDGVGEWTTTSLAIGKGNRLNLIKDIAFPHSLGLLYSAFTYYTGFKVNSGEYKVMGLAPYGEPRFVKLILEHLIDIKDDGSFRLDMKYFNYCIGFTMTSELFHKLFGGLPRKAEDPLTQREMDLAASIQLVTEIVLLKMAKAIQKETSEENLCLAGGVALNCVANGKLHRAQIFKNIWIQPAAGDAGGALGAALIGYHEYLSAERILGGAKDFMQGGYLGPSFNQDEIESRLASMGARVEILDEEMAIFRCAELIAEGKAIGWFQGRMEFGPRALGGRSILADPRSPSMQSTLNLKVKYRESFRPFAPSILMEDLENYFDLNVDSPYMMLVADVLPSRRIANSRDLGLFGIEKLNIPRSDIPAVTHVDFSARIQTVHALTNYKYHKLLTRFKEITGCPVLINTSFNVRGEPIVNTPEDAFRCFMGTELDALLIGNCLLKKDEQNPALKLEYTSAFEAD